MRRFSAAYTRPYQAHGSIGPSCAVARLDGDDLTVWTHTQGVFPDREAIAELLRVAPEHVRCIHAQGSGCYGHNGADDAAGDAALIARALPGRPVRVQLMREQEAAWEPFGPAMATHAEAALDADGRIVDWSYAVWSSTHNMRPGGAGTLLAGQLLAEPFAPPEPKPLPLPEGGGDRNEKVGFAAGGIGSVDWATYPILRFDAVPDAVEVHLIDRPGQPFLGCGECGQGPTGAALANAIADAAGVRLRDLPLTRDKVMPAIGA